MTTPADPERDPSAERVDLSKGEPADEPAFDPYRFGKPDHPIPAEYAPPGYTGPVIPTAPPSAGWGATHPAGNPANPFSNPPGTPYTPYGTDPGGYPPGPYPPAPPGQYPPPYGPPSGYYPPGPHYGYQPQPAVGQGKSIAALVLGIGSIVFSAFSLLDAVLIIPGLIFALIAMKETKTTGIGRGLAVAGLICTIIGAALATLFTVLLIHAANQCGGFDNKNAPGYNNCLRDHVF